MLLLPVALGGFEHDHGANRALFAAKEGLEYASVGVEPGQHGYRLGLAVSEVLVQGDERRSSAGTSRSRG
jgi:hypothetical protein